MQKNSHLTEFPSDSKSLNDKNFLVRTLNYAADNDAFEWDLAKFANDPKLDNIYSGLSDLISKGRQIYHPVIPSSILILSIISEDRIEVSCAYKMTKNSVRGKIFVWNANQVNMFLDYIKKHNIF